MRQFDREWNRVSENILANGVWQDENHVRAKWDDGTLAPTKFVTGEKMIFDNTEALVPESKELPEQSPKKELEWIWIDKSNRVQDLRDKGVTIWDKWEIKEGEWAGTIGPAYGYQLRRPVRKMPISKVQWNHLAPKNAEYLKWAAEEKGVDYVMLDQVDYLIQGLLTNPGSRRYMTTLWGIEHLDEMKLEPCVWKTKWAYVDGKIDLIVGIRSNDICVGNPFNVYQYQVLQHMICQITGHGVGKLQFDICRRVSRI
jgi:thymidylate synthase